MSTNSPSVQNELDAYAQQKATLLTQQAAQQSIITTLSLKPQPLSVDDQKVYSAALSAKAGIALQMQNLLLQESATVASIQPNAIAAVQQKQVLVANQISTTPLPQQGNLTLIHPAVDFNDIITYMSYTQHLNPYGRQRQCDIDLQNLMGLINQDVNAAVGDYQALISSLTVGSITGSD